MRRQAVCLCAVLIGCALFFASVPGQAHAILRRATPGVGATIHAAPANLRLWFSEELNVTRCHVDILDSGGHSVLSGKPQTSSDDPKELIVPLEPALSSGRYHVHWEAVSKDDHVTMGDFVFQIAN